MTRTRNAFLGALAALLIPVAANADLNDAAANLTDNGTYTSDKTTGLDWLDLSVTANTTYDSAETNNPGWRYATNAEVEALFALFFEPTFVDSGDGSQESTDADSIAESTLFISLLGAPINNDPYFSALGYYLDEDDILRAMGTEYETNVVALIIGPEWYLQYGGSARQGYGTYLVRETLPTLPTLMSLADVNGNNSTDLGVLLRDNDKNKLFVMDGDSGNNIKTVSFGTERYRGSATVPDVTGDQIPEIAVLVQGSLFARVKDVANNTLLGSPAFNDDLTPVAVLAIDDIGGGVGPELAVVGRNTSNGKVQAQITDVASGSLVNTLSFSKTFQPFAAVVVHNVGDSAAQEIAVLGINESGNVQVQVKDALTGTQISKFNFAKAYKPLAFAAVPNPGGKLKFLAVLGRNNSGVIRAEIRRAIDGALIGKINFSKSYEPQAFISFADSNGSGGGEISVIGVNNSGAVRAQTREIADGAAVTNINFSKSYPPVDAIAINGVAGTGLNEIAVLGQHTNGQYRLQIKDLLTGATVNTIPVP